MNWINSLYVYITYCFFLIKSMWTWLFGFLLLCFLFPVLLSLNALCWQNWCKPAPTTHQNYNVIYKFRLWFLNLHGTHIWAYRYNNTYKHIICSIIEFDEIVLVCLVCSWNYCNIHFNINLTNKNKIEIKVKVLIVLQKYFSFKK